MIAEDGRGVSAGERMRRLKDRTGVHGIYVPSERTDRRSDASRTAGGRT